MDLFQSMTDDQIALIGGGAAFFFCGGLMAVSHHLRRFTWRDNVSRVDGRTHRSRTGLAPGQGAAKTDRKAA